jgi:hypothetical protein
VDVVSANLRRFHYTPTQRATIAVEIEPKLAEEAKGRMTEGQKKGGETAGRGRKKDPDSSEENFPQSYRADQSRDEAARLVKANPHYVTDAKGGECPGAGELAAVLVPVGRNLGQLEADIEVYRERRSIFSRGSAARAGVHLPGRAAPPWNSINERKAQWNDNS